MSNTTTTNIGYTILDISRWNSEAIQLFNECYTFIKNNPKLETIIEKYPWLETLVYCFEICLEGDYAEPHIKDDKIWIWEGPSPEYGTPRWVEGLAAEIIVNRHMDWKQYAVLSCRTTETNKTGCEYFLDSKVTYIMPHTSKEFSTVPKEDTTSVIGAKEALKTWVNFPVTSKYRTSCANMSMLLDAAINNSCDETFLRKSLMPYVAKLLKYPGNLNWGEYNVLANFYRVLEKCEYPCVPRFKELSVNAFNNLKNTCTVQKKKSPKNTL